MGNIKYYIIFLIKNEIILVQIMFPDTLINNGEGCQILEIMIVFRPSFRNFRALAIIFNLNSIDKLEKLSAI